jgi:hypothetical protein
MGVSKGEQAESSELTEREGSSDEHRANTLEAVGEATRVAPESPTVVAAEFSAVWATSADADDTDEDEDDDHQKLEARGPELFLSVTERAEYREDH